MPQKTVTHLITGLGKGGAETMLYQVLKYGSDQNVRYRVISMGGGTYYAERIRELGIEVTVCRFKRRPVSSFIKIVRLLKSTDVLSCWMYHANFVGYLAGRVAHVGKIIWNIRHSDLSRELNTGLTLRVNKWCAKRSKKISAVVYNGEKSREIHEALGYLHDKGMVLDNGVDTDLYSPNENAKSGLCAELGTNGANKIVLSVTRYHPIKDIPTFINSFGAVHKELPDAVAVMCGSGIESRNEHIADLCRNNRIEIGKDIFLLGLRDDVNRLMAASDLFVLHSAGEAFPNTLIQAMSCGCLCIATDVGDVSRILDNSELIVEPGDPEKMGKKMIEMLGVSHQSSVQIKRRNRENVEAHYKVKNVARVYEDFCLSNLF